MAPSPKSPTTPPQEKRWRGADLAAQPEQWLRDLSNDERSAFLAAGNGALDLLDEPLLRSPVLQALADDVRNALLDGHGFIVLRGLDVTLFSPTNLATAYYRFGRLIGLPRSQNAAGHVLGHVRDIGADLKNPTTRIYQTNQRQTFHTDSSDAVGLLCVKTAAEGGMSLLASATTVYAACVDRDPELAALLFEPLATDRRNEQPPGEKAWFEIPVLSWFDEHLTVLYQRQYVESARRFDAAPNPDVRHTAALDLFDDIVNDPDVHLRMDLQPGDMQFVHNHSLLHDRTGFVDHPHPVDRRHLLRLWLSLPGDRELPQTFQQRYGPIDVGRRGGIVLAGTQLTMPLDELNTPIDSAGLHRSADSTD